MNNNLQITPPEKGTYKYLHTVEAGAWLPTLQMIITGIVAGIATLVVLWVLNVLDPWKPALIVTVITWLAGWVLLQFHWFRLTEVERLERLLKTDLNGDGLVGKQKPTYTRVTVYRQEGGRIKSSVSADIPLSPSELEQLAKALIIRGMSFSETVFLAEPRFIPGMTAPRFRQLQDIMEKRGLIVLKKPPHKNQGYKLSEDGEALLVDILRNSPTYADFLPAQYR